METMLWGKMKGIASEQTWENLYQLRMTHEQQTRKLKESHQNEHGRMEMASPMIENAIDLKNSCKKNARLFKEMNR